MSDDDDVFYDHVSTPPNSPSTPFEHLAFSGLPSSPMQPGVPSQHAPSQDLWVLPIGNDGSVACGVFLLLARRHVPGDVHPTLHLALCALHMLWASVDDASPTAVARQSFLRLATKGAVSLTNSSDAATVPSHEPCPMRRLASICHGPRANTIVRVDTEGLTGVTAIAAFFLFSCSNLLSVNLRGLKNVDKIGAHFLAGCWKLKVVDLAPLARVKAIGDWFISFCVSLTSIDLAPLAQLTTLPVGFLSGCYSLQSLDCRPLRSVINVGALFLFSCAALRELNVSSFATVARVAGTFLYRCTALRHVDLSSMTNVTELHELLLLHGHQLESLVRPDRGELATVAIAGF